MYFHGTNQTTGGKSVVKGGQGRRWRVLHEEARASNIAKEISDTHVRVPYIDYFCIGYILIVTE